MVLKFLLVLAVALAQLENWEYKKGRCHPIKKLDSLDTAFFTNKFYQILRSKGFPLLFGQCVTSTRTFVPENTVLVRIQQIFMGMRLSGNATVTIDLENKLGEYKISSPLATLEGNYVITDSSTYFMTYICESEEENRRDLLEIYSTDVNFNATFLLPIVSSLGFNSTEYDMINHSPEACATNPI